MSAKTWDHAVCPQVPKMKNQSHSPSNIGGRTHVGSSSNKALFFEQLHCQHLAVGQNQWYHFGVGAPLILVYFSGDWDVHWAYDLDFDPWVFV